MPLPELATAFNFEVYIDNKKIPFSRVSGIEECMETGTIQEGGRNNTEYKGKKKGKVKNTLILERALPKVQKDETYIYAGKTIEREVIVYLTDVAGKIYWAYYFIGCTISKVSLEGLDAGRSDVLMQRVEITFQNMEEESM